MLVDVTTPCSSPSIVAMFAECDMPASPACTISDRAGLPAGESSPRAGACDARTNTAANDARTNTATSDDNQTERQIIGDNSRQSRPARTRRARHVRSKADLRAFLDRFEHFFQSGRAGRAVSQQSNQEPVHF